MQKTKTPMNPDTERSALDTPTDLEKQSTMKIAAEINKLVADALALYLKTKNFHWHMSGPHFRDYHLLLDEQATQIYATVDPLAERVRKLGQPTLRSIGQIAKLSRIKDNNEEFVSPYEHACRTAAKTTRRWPSRCATRIRSATTTKTSRRRAFSKPFSTRPRSGPGSCSRRRAAPAPAATERGGRSNASASERACRCDNRRSRAASFCRASRLRHISPAAGRGGISNPPGPHAAPA